MEIRGTGARQQGVTGLGDHGGPPISRRRAGEVQASRVPAAASPRLSSPMTGHGECGARSWLLGAVCLLVDGPVVATLSWAVYI